MRNEKIQAGYGEIFGPAPYGAKWLKGGKYYNSLGDEIDMETGKVVGMVPEEDYGLFGRADAGALVSPAAAENPAEALPSNVQVIGKVEEPTEAPEPAREDLVLEAQARIVTWEEKLEALEAAEEPDKNKIRAAKTQITKARNALAAL